MRKYVSEIIENMNAVPGFHVQGVEKETATHFVQEEDSMSYPICIECFGITFEDKNYEINRDHQKRYVLEYVISGKGTVIIDNKRFEVQGGDTYLLEANTKQRYFANKKDPFKKYWVNFAGDKIDSLLDLYGLKGIYHFPKANTEDLFVELFALEKVSSFSNAISYKAASIIFSMFMVLKQSTSREARVVPQSVVLAKRLIDENLTEKLSIEEICQKTYMSKPTLISKFQKYYGDTPNQYKIKRKADLASIMLRSSNFSIGQIASELGFPDSYSFSHWFKKMKGLTPSNYRKNKS